MASSTEADCHHTPEKMFARFYPVGIFFQQIGPTRRWQHRTGRTLPGQSLFAELVSPNRFLIRFCPFSDNSGEAGTVSTFSVFFSIACILSEIAFSRRVLFFSPVNFIDQSRRAMVLCNRFRKKALGAVEFGFAQLGFDLMADIH
jgi:hypothetical protein